jgi:phosphate transport system protein
MEHTLKSLDRELEKLHAAILSMGALACEQLQRAVEAIAGGNLQLAEHVVSGDEQIDRLEEEINALVLRLLALQAPVADDLRATITALKIASALERVGDYAVSIAKRVAALKGLPPLRSVRTLERMGKMAVGLLADVLDAYAEGDAAKAENVWQRDRELDELHSGLFRELLTYMMEDSRHIAACTHLLFIAKNIERAGDHATNIGEMVCFIVKGQTLGGERPKGDSASLPAAEGE